MARPINKLTPRKVAALDQVGRHADGGGLYLRVTPSRSKSWVFMVVIAGKRKEIGLGSAANVPLATARGLAAEMREAVTLGRDPESVRSPRKSESIATTPTFGAFAEAYITGVEQGWKSAVHRQQWRNSLRDHAHVLFDIPVDALSKQDVLGVLEPIWLTKAETASRVRGRIEKILSAAKSEGHIPKDATNPAAWAGHLEFSLPKRGKLQRGHHAALPFKAAPDFMAELRGRPALAARCLEFVILTAARSSEALGADWAEIDFDAELWIVPAERMKAGAKHEVPLSKPAIEVLKALQPDKAQRNGRIFAVDGAIRSNMAMTMLLRRMKRGDITTHGFRSTFRDWAGETTNYPRDLVEMALAHTIQNKAEEAYRRLRAVERRRILMVDWAKYLHEGLSVIDYAPQST